MAAPSYFIPPFEPFCTKLIFYRIPKNASTSIYDALGFHNLIKIKEKEIEKSADPRLYRRWFSATHLKPEELKKTIGPGIARYFSFCVVRNPWDRAVSMYKFAKKKNLNNLYGIDGDFDFAHFCDVLYKNKDDPFFIGSHQQIQWAKGEEKPDKTIRFENLQNEYSEMIEQIGLNIDSKKLPILNSTKHKHYSYYYDKKSKELINEIFYDDITVFDYSFDSVFDLRDRVKKKQGGFIL
jgi:hypothetical protein